MCVAQPHGHCAYILRAASASPQRRMYNFALSTYRTYRTWPRRCHACCAGDEEAKRRGGQKSVLERQGLPTFDVCVEMLSRSEWAIWEDVGIVVDMILLGRQPPVQVRMCFLLCQSRCTKKVCSDDVSSALIHASASLTRSALTFKQLLRGVAVRIAGASSTCLKSETVLSSKGSLQLHALHMRHLPMRT
jgi:hypothetical protein